MALAYRDAAPEGIVSGPDGALWFTEAGRGAIGRSTSAGRATEFALPNRASRPTAIVAGRDGNLWFSERNAASIGRITPTGSVTEFPIPAAPAGASSRPSSVVGAEGITVGPDGEVWFALPGADRLGRITAAGAVSELALRDGGAPDTVALGADGNLWVSGARNGVDRVTAAGRVTFLPTTIGGGNNITAAPDGNLYLIDGDHLIKLSTRGVVAHIRLHPDRGVPFDYLRGLAAGGDGNLWFTDPGANAIGRVTPAGSVTSFPIPTFAASPYGIGAGPDGAMWFTAFGASALGRVPVGGEPTRSATLRPPRISPASASRRATLGVSFVVPARIPDPLSLLPGDDPQGAPDTPSYFSLEIQATDRRRQRSRCVSGATYAIVPDRKRRLQSSDLIAPAVGHPGARVNVRLKPSGLDGSARRVRAWCAGRLSFALSIGYLTVPGPGSDFVHLLDYPKAKARIR